MKISATVFLLLGFLGFLSTGWLGAQTGSHEIVGHAQPLPPVFLLGEYDKQYETIMPGYTTLLEVCDGNMNLAFDKLMTMMREMEAYAISEGYDIKGVNAWMHFFWAADGSIEHIGFYLKPNSRNVNTGELQKFLGNFARQYEMPIRANKKFSHYSSFTFPIVFQNPESEKGTARKKGDSNY